MVLYLFLSDFTTSKSRDRTFIFFMEKLLQKSGSSGVFKAFNYKPNDQFMFEENKYNYNKAFKIRGVQKCMQ